MTLPASLRKFLPSVVWIRFGIAAAAVLLTAWTQWLPPVSGSYLANEWLRDRFIRVRADTTLEQRIVMVDIDEASLGKVGPWPWPRERLADLVENLVGHYKVAGVALDLVMPEPADAQGDARLAMLAQHGPVVLAQVLDYIDRGEPLRVGRITGGAAAQSSPFPALGSAQLADAAQSGQSGQASPPSPSSQSSQSAQSPQPTQSGRFTPSALPAAKATGYIANHAGFAGTRHVGNIGFVPDPDGTIRYLPMITSFQGREYLTLSAMLFQCCANGQPPRPDEEGFWRIPYGRDWSAYTLLSASDVLSAKAPAQLLENRLVIIGSSSLGLTDRVATPLAPSTSGMLVHASALSAMLDAQEGKAPARWPGRWIAVLFAVLVAGIAAYSFPRYSALSNVALLSVASALWLLLAYWIAQHDPSFSTTGPLASNLLLLAVGVPFDWQLAQRKSHSLLGTLRQYVATAVVDELLQRDLKDPLTPRELTVTTLIADMEGYTTYVEALSIEDAAQLTRDFLACLTRPVLTKRGTIDKYTGDGMVAFWGAPLPVEDHADLALEAAQAIVEEVRRFSEVRMKAGMPALRVRIGIESGIAMAGDFGSSSRSIYTAVGDSVNVAARLEQVARNQPYDIIIGQGAVSRATRHTFKLLGDFSLRGKERTHTLYTLEGHTTSRMAAP